MPFDDARRKQSNGATRFWVWKSHKGGPFANMNNIGLERHSTNVLLLFRPRHQDRKSGLATRPSASEKLLPYENAYRYLSVRMSLKNRLFLNLRLVLSKTQYGRIYRQKLV